jgi:stage V sporulation protein S
VTGHSWGPQVEVLKVSSKSNPNSVAGALAGAVRGAGAVEVQVVGAGALNQAVKGIAIARGYVTSSGLDLICRPTFADIQIDGESRTAIRLLVEACMPGPAGIWAPQAADTTRPARQADETRPPASNGPQSSPDDLSGPEALTSPCPAPAAS